MVPPPKDLVAELETALNSDECKDLLQHVVTIIPGRSKPMASGYCYPVLDFLCSCRMIVRLGDRLDPVSTDEGDAVYCVVSVFQQVYVFSTEYSC